MDYIVIIVWYVEECVYVKDLWNFLYLCFFFGVLFDFMFFVVYLYFFVMLFVMKFVYVSSNKIRMSVNKVMFMLDG